MNPLSDLRSHAMRLCAGFSSLPPREQLRRGVFWGAIALTSLVIAITSYQIQKIPDTIRADISTVLNKRPWIDELVVIDGRDVYLRGEVEPKSGLETELAMIASVDGVRSVTSVVEETPKPSPYLHIDKAGDDLQLSGELNGDTQEWVSALLASQFSGLRVQDKVVIDDRLGRPLWLEGFDQSLSHLLSVENLAFDGWRDQLLYSGKVNDRDLVRQLGYAIPASLIPQVKTTNRITLNVQTNHPELAVLADWNGASIYGTVPSAGLRDDLIHAVQTSFGIQVSGTSLVVDTQRKGAKTMEKVIPFIRVLDQVRELRLETSGDGFIVWGRVDDPDQLGRILASRNALGLDQIVRNRVRVAPPSAAPQLSMFSDGRQAVISGTLPSVKIKQLVLADIARILGAASIVDLISVEPGILYTPWLQQWEDILHQLPRKTVGLSINADSVVVTGNLDSEEERADLELGLALVFSDSRLLNWTTAAQ